MEGTCIRKLPDAELAVMMALWSADRPVPRSWLEERLVEKKWNTKTINTYLIRLTEKGAVHSQRQGKTNYYSPAYSREEYLEFENRSFLEKLYGSSLKNFMAAMVSSKKLKKSALEELRRYLNQLEDGSSKE